MRAFIIVLLVVLISCAASTTTNNEEKKIDSQTSSIDVEHQKEFDAYWNAGTAEITSYKLEQARYGEIREGTSVMIFVTEPFNPNKQVKSDNPDSKSIPVLKLNQTKNFITGIYPYSIMTSSFAPISNPESHLIKSVFSSQEWCGQIYTQMNKKGSEYEVQNYSYFETEGDTKFNIDVNWLEDELWSVIRINPEVLPVGEVRIIPSSSYLNMMHKTMKVYDATITKIEKNKEVKYTITYTDLEREVVINYSTEFPFIIESWKETYKSGFGSSAIQLTSKGTKLKSIKSPYWGKNHNSDEYLRKELMLD